MSTESKFLPPHLFNVGDILYVPCWPSDGTNHLWLVIGIGVARNIMDMNSGYTMPAYDANRWLRCKKLEGIRIKCLHFIPNAPEYDIPVVIKNKNGYL